MNMPLTASIARRSALVFVFYPSAYTQWRQRVRPPITSQKRIMTRLSPPLIRLRSNLTMFSGRRSQAIVSARYGFGVRVIQPDAARNLPSASLRFDLGFCVSRIFR